MYERIYEYIHMHDCMYVYKLWNHEISGMAGMPKLYLKCLAPICAGRGERILFSLLVVVLFWVNHLCTRLSDDSSRFDAMIFQSILRQRPGRPLWWRFST